MVLHLLNIRIDTCGLLVLNYTTPLETRKIRSTSNQVATSLLDDPALESLAMAPNFLPIVACGSQSFYCSA